MPQRFIAIPAALSHLTTKAVYAGEASEQKLFDVGMAMGQRLWLKSLLLSAESWPRRYRQREVEYRNLG
jgi:hypothetical protein